jgi:hypothetical protein
MQHDLKELMGSSVIAADGKMGRVRNFLFDDISWTIRYLVVDVGTWHQRRDVVLPITTIELPDWAKRIFHVSLTRAQVRYSPDVDTEKPDKDREPQKPFLHNLPPASVRPLIGEQPEHEALFGRGDYSATGARLQYQLALSGAVLRSGGMPEILARRYFRQGSCRESLRLSAKACIRH